MTKNNLPPKENFIMHDLDEITKIASDHALDDLFEIKEVDRKLSYFVVGPSSVICDVGGASGVDAFPLAMFGSLCVCLDINKVEVKRGKILSKRRGIDTKLEYIVASAINMPFRSSSLDLVTCFSVLDHLPDKNCFNLAVSEFSRVVKDQGYVTITGPNMLFLIGTISMKLKQLLDSDAFFEQRFTPKEMEKTLVLSGLKPLASDSKYPTKIGATILKSNFPKIVSRIPQSLYKPVFSIAEQIFRKLNKRSWLKLFGARFGYLSQKRRQSANA